jgi:glycosyltransferase involved in cell wall biosynthesis
MTAGPRVEILLATYNGARYLREQLDSLVAQTHRPLSLVVRDDGSTDDTPAIVAAYADRLPLRTLPGGHLGVRRSFFALLAAADPTADYVAFCDQDDVWNPDKLARAVARLRPCDPAVPALYCARAVLTDGALNPIGHTRLPTRPPGFANALIENIASGMATVMNRAAVALINAQQPSAAVNPIHDWWAYQAVTACGTAIYDPEPALLYRQHGRNTIGVARGPFAGFRARVMRQVSGQSRGEISALAAELRRCLGPRMTPAARALLDDFLRPRGLAARIGYVLRCPLHRQRPSDDLAFRLLYLLGRV